MIRDWVQYDIDELIKCRDKIKVFGEKIEKALIEVGVKEENIVIAVHINHDGMAVFLRIMPFHGSYNCKFDFFYKDGYLNNEYYRSEKDVILGIQNRTRRYLKLHPEVNIYRRDD